MIISRTPYRISLFGGGTDYPAWYQQHGGAVLSTTIDKYCYLTCRYLPPFFAHSIRVVYSQIENCSSVDEIKHPAVREVLRMLAIDRGVEIHHDGDLPARSGMGSSSAFTVGLIHALRSLTGHMPTKHDLALGAIEIEQERLRENVGSQDQVAAAYGGLNTIAFEPNGAFSVRPVTLRRERVEELNAHLMLFFTGIQRNATSVAAAYEADTPARESAMRTVRGMVDEALGLLASPGDLAPLGKLMHEAWLLKRGLGKHVTSPAIDAMYEAARKAGAHGGKLTGAGGGGFLLCVAPPERRAHIRRALDHLIYVPFELEYSGSQIIFYGREQDYPVEEEERKSGKIAAFQSWHPPKEKP
jgi:D-glycero-alpha-D-manno-heptose-7-phosphate kinase